MSTIDYYREQAARCRRLATGVFDYEIARRLFELAEEFEEKAEEAIKQQAQAERSSEWPALTIPMADKIVFLYEAATELRAIATMAPEIAWELCRMAEELEEKAAELARARRDRIGRADAP